ncbi:pilus assembly protein TadG-related protein [Arthrobacter sp. A2-55]|nr:pilus assembly protein TadG-related protein [Arthrobacter sp. A2-55]
MLLGFAAISVDVGMMYAEKAQLQNGADSAALAIAYDCAKSTTSAGCAAPTPVATAMANANANDHMANTNGVNIDFTKRTVTVNVSSKSTANPNAIQLAFANVFGISSANVPATATAIWPATDTLSTIPWTIGNCEFMASLTAAQKSSFAATGNFTVDPAKTPIYLRSDQTASYPGCDSGAGYAAGGFGWIQPQASECMSIPTSPPYIVDGWVGNASQKVLTWPSCSGLLDSLLNKDAYIPIFSTSTSSGINATYTLTGFAIFHVTGWHFQPPNHDGVNPPACLPTGNNCRGFFGYFVGFVSIHDYIALHPLPSDKTVRLIQ